MQSVLLGRRDAHLTHGKPQNKSHDEPHDGPHDEPHDNQKKSRVAEHEEEGSAARSEVVAAC